VRQVNTNRNSVLQEYFYKEGALNIFSLRKKAVNLWRSFTMDFRNKTMRFEGSGITYAEDTVYNHLFVLLMMMFKENAL
jgi:hypothetical protein